MAYVYEPLKSDEHIRVIELDPSDDQAAPLHCSIVQQHLNDIHLPYDAISYTWSGQARDRPMYVNRSQNVVHITANLDSALRRFRSRHKVRRLWADAACINQADDVEKGKQIPHMGSIFRSARMVRAWLKDNSQSDYSRGMMRLAQAGKSRLDQKIEMNEAMYKFLSHKYFFRRWIIQELVLNSQTICYCGTSKVAWSTLSLAISRLMESNTEVDKPIQNLSTLGDLALSLGRGSASPHGLLELLDKFVYHGCADERDRIYALIGLAHDVHGATSAGLRNLEILPDYTVCWKQAYRKLAKDLIRCDEVLPTLFEAVRRRPSVGLTELPSWVPDFRRPSRAMPLSFTKLYEMHEGNQMAMGQAETDGDILNVEVSVYTFRYRSVDLPARWNGLCVLSACSRPLDVVIDRLGHALRDLMAWMLQQLPTYDTTYLERTKERIARLFGFILDAEADSPYASSDFDDESLCDFDRNQPGRASLDRPEEAFFGRTEFSQSEKTLYGLFAELLKDTKLSFTKACEIHDVTDVVGIWTSMRKLSFYVSTPTYFTHNFGSGRNGGYGQIIGAMLCEPHAQDIILIQAHRSSVRATKSRNKKRPLFMVRKQTPGYKAIGCGPYVCIGSYLNSIRRPYSGDLYRQIREAEEFSIGEEKVDLSLSMV